VRIISKSGNHLYWLTVAREYPDSNPYEKPKLRFFICQQVPMILDNFDEKSMMIANEAEFYKVLQ